MRAVRELIVATALFACSAPPPIDAQPDAAAPDATPGDASTSDAPFDAGPPPDRTCADDPEACSRAACAADADRIGMTSRTDSAGATYTAYAPASYDPTKLAHVVVALHGGFGSPGAAAAYLTGTWQSAADSAGFLVVAPETPLDGGQGYWSFGADGASWVLGVVDDFRRCYSIDARRVILGGFSSGGQAAYALGLARADRFSGLAITGADYLTSLGLAREAGVPDLLPSSWLIPISNFAGTSDPAASLNGAVLPGMQILVDAGHPFDLHVFDGGHVAGTDPAFALQMYVDHRGSITP